MLRAPSAIKWMSRVGARHLKGGKWCQGWSPGASLAYLDVKDLLFNCKSECVLSVQPWSSPLLSSVLPFRPWLQQKARASMTTTGTCCHPLLRDALIHTRYQREQAPCWRRTPMLYDWGADLVPSPPRVGVQTDVSIGFLPSPMFKTN